MLKSGTIYVGVVWLGCAIACAAYMASYAATPGMAAHTPMQWPQGTAVHLDSTRPTLIMLLHSKCSCSQSSIEELARLVAQSPNMMNLHLFFYNPETANGDEDHSLWEQALLIPGVNLHKDIEGREAARFGATTSGHVALFAPNGSLLFNGGITAARGHSGDNQGINSITQILQHRVERAETTPTYGCGLRGPA